MGSIFRSEKMQLSQLILHTDSAYMCLSELGELGVVHIRDTTPGVNAFQRKFVDEVRRCDEMDRKLRFIESQIATTKLIIFETDEIPEAPPPREMLELESNLEKLDSELNDINLNLENFKKKSMELTELRLVLRRAQVFFEEGSYEVTTNLPHGEDMLEEAQFESETKPLRVGDIEMLSQTDDLEVGFRSGFASTLYQPHHVDFVAGVISRERVAAFERMLWRICRGNVFLRYSDIESIEDPITGDLLEKCMFIVFFQGSQLKSRVEKICDGFHATIYNCPDTQEQRQSTLMQISGDFEDLMLVIKQTCDHRDRVLEAASLNIRKWFYKVHKMKSIYYALNLFNLDVSTKCMIGECWAAVSDLDSIQMALRRGMERSNSTLQPILNRLHTTEIPPTFHRTNKFTEAFQNIVDSYGVAKYQEVNPTLFSAITFPFLFAVMFGDAGHGAIMFLAGLFLVLWEKKLIAKRIKGELWDTFFGGRYIIMLMGAFSVYTGFIYNDIFSRATNVFGSSWYPLYDNKTIALGAPLQLNPITHSTKDPTGMFTGYPYPFGLDPIWQVSGNSIMFTNSLKMKMSIILGVTHMLFGILLGAFNHRFFKDPLAIYCELIPQVLFMFCLFGYLSIAIFYKWIVFGSADASTAPSLLITLINMMRFSYETSPDVLPLYTGQAIVQSTLVVIAVLCVPWMLLAKPLILRHKHRSSYPVFRAMAGIGSGEGDDETVLGSSRNGGGAGTNYTPFRNEPSPKGSQDLPQSPLSATSRDGPTGDHGHVGASAEFVFSEVMVYQAIHTIEFCLGCISNTASYLRLWALSLAHAQLSEVLWNMVLHYGICVNGYYGSIALFVIFGLWAVLTIGILVIMEGLSAFLHALRLHWVEFMGKFYEGSGYLFQPFSFKSIDYVLPE